MSPRPPAPSLGKFDFEDGARLVAIEALYDSVTEDYLIKNK